MVLLYSVLLSLLMTVTDEFLAASRRKKMLPKILPQLFVPDAVTSTTEIVKVFYSLTLIKKADMSPSHSTEQEKHYPGSSTPILRW